MTKCFAQIHLPKQNQHSIALSKLWESFPSMRMQIKQGTCFKEKGAISTLSGKPIKSVNQFTNLCSNISSTESDVQIHLVKVWTAIDWLSIIWKSDLSDKIKQLLPSYSCVLTTIWKHHMYTKKTL